MAERGGGVRAKSVCITYSYFFTVRSKTNEAEFADCDAFRSGAALTIFFPFQFPETYSLAYIPSELHESRPFLSYASLNSPPYRHRFFLFFIYYIAINYVCIENRCFFKPSVLLCRRKTRLCTGGRTKTGRRCDFVNLLVRTSLAVRKINLYRTLQRLVNYFFSFLERMTLARK